jgi:hypothetical protein
MMHRRGFGFRRLPANSNISPALQRAHELMGLGNYTEAAIAFENLAQGAEKRKGPRAPFLFLQAGNARIQLNQNSVGMGHLRHGLEMFSASGRYHQLYRSGGRIIQELKTRGLVKEAQEISRLVHSHIPAISESPTQRGPDPSRVTLPVHCPACGGPVRSDEVDWIDANTAECSFCGSPIRAEA